MKLSARNVLKGRIVEVVKGQTTARVKIHISPGAIITAAFSNEAVDALELSIGDVGHAVIKASDVIIAKE